MADFILIDGDKAIFLPSFGPAVVVVRPGDLKGSGPATFTGKRICVDGDEKRVAVPGCVYMTPVYSIPGTGTLKISALAGDQKASKTSTGGKAVLLKGSQFTARFEVQSPAQQPPPGPGPPIPDAMPQYTGSGMFVTTNFKFQGT
jgi:Contractile injection system spike tip protein